MEAEEARRIEQRDVAVEEPIASDERQEQKAVEGLGFKTPESKALSDTPEQGSRGELDEIMKYPDGYEEEQLDEHGGDEVIDAHDGNEEFSEMDSQMAEVYTDFLYNRAVGDFDREYAAALKLVVLPQRLTGINEEPEDIETQSRSRTSMNYPPKAPKRKIANILVKNSGLNLKKITAPFRNAEGSLMTAPSDESRIRSFLEPRNEEGEEASSQHREFDSRRSNTYSMEDHTFLLRKKKREEKMKQSMLQSNERFPELLSQTFDYQKVLKDSAQDLQIRQQEVDEKLRVLREQRESRERTSRDAAFAPLIKAPIKISRKTGPYLMEDRESAGFQGPRAESSNTFTRSEDHLARAIVSGAPPSAFKLLGSNNQRVVVDPAQADWVHNLMAEQREREARKKRREERRQLQAQAEQQHESEQRREKQRLDRMIRLAKVENRIHAMHRRREDNREAAQVQNRVVKQLLQRPQMFYFFKASGDAVSRVKETLWGKRDPAGYKRVPPELLPG